MKEQLERDRRHLQKVVQELQTTVTQDPSTRIALLAHNKARLRELETALKRCQNGTYGICEVCGGLIEAERLEVLSDAVTCSVCAHGHNAGSTAQSRSKLTEVSSLRLPSPVYAY